MAVEQQPVSNAKTVTKTFRITARRSHPLGSTVEKQGINFAFFSANAEKIELDRPIMFKFSGTPALNKTKINKQINQELISLLR